MGLIHVDCTRVVVPIVIKYLRNAQTLLHGCRDSDHGGEVQPSTLWAASQEHNDEACCKQHYCGIRERKTR